MQPSAVSATDRGSRHAQRRGRTRFAHVRPLHTDWHTDWQHQPCRGARISCRGVPLVSAACHGDDRSPLPPPPTLGGGFRGQVASTSRPARAIVAPRQHPLRGSGDELDDAQLGSATRPRHVLLLRPPSSARCVRAADGGLADPPRLSHPLPVSAVPPTSGARGGRLAPGQLVGTVCRSSSMNPSNGSRAAASASSGNHPRPRLGPSGVIGRRQPPTLHLDEPHVCPEFRTDQAHGANVVHRRVRPKASSVSTSMHTKRPMMARSRTTSSSIGGLPWGTIPAGHRGTVPDRERTQVVKSGRVAGVGWLERSRRVVHSPRMPSASPTCRTPSSIGG